MKSAIAILIVVLLTSLSSFASEYNLPKLEANKTSIDTLIERKLIACISGWSQILDRRRCSAEINAQLNAIKGVSGFSELSDQLRSYLVKNNLKTPDKEIGIFSTAGEKKLRH